jgi:hypothetical protein
MKVKMERPFNAFYFPVKDTLLWKFGTYLLLRIVLMALFFVPSQAVLVRCQASLLPEDDETVIPVDRTFGVDVVREQGYLSVLEAWKSLKGTWGRLYTLWVKIFLITFVVEVLVSVIIVLEFISIRLYVSQHRGPH